MDKGKAYSGWKIDGSVFSVSDILANEKALEISLNGKPLIITMRSPGGDKELGIGFLFLENIIRRIEDVIIQFIEGAELDALLVTTPINNINDDAVASRSFLSLSSCGICGKTDLEFPSGSLSTGIKLSLGTVLRGFESMLVLQDDFKRTGGCHGAALIDSEGRLLVVQEDIGRHNAVDKVVGFSLLNSLDNKAIALLVSGRVSYEIVIKCFRAKIPVLCAVSAPSSMAVDYAKELGITLCGFVREHRLTVYSHPERIDEVLNAGSSQ